MDKELQDYFDNYFMMFASDGWKQLMEEMQDALETVNDLTMTADANDFYFRKGKVDIYRQLLAFQDLINQSFEEHSNG